MPTANAAKNFTAPPSLTDKAAHDEAAAGKNRPVKTPLAAPVIASERRSGRDRRQRDDPPPRGRDRRRGLEPRRPEVLELELTPSQWDALHSEAFPVTAKAPAKT